MGIRFVGARDVEPDGLEVLEGRFNFMLGGDPETWKVDVPAYRSVIYREIYPGVDLIYRAEGDQLKSEFRLRPGARVESIRWEYESGAIVHHKGSGELVVKNGSFSYSEKIPKVYVAAGSKQRTLEGGYKAHGARAFGFWLGEFERREEVVIDPVVSFSTFLGGSGADAVRALTLDGQGNVYAAGYTESSDLVLANPFQSSRRGGVDAFVAKLSPSGALIYCTYLGGSGDDRAFSIAVDGSGNAHVGGWTYSTNFPVSPTAIQKNLRGGRDGFLVKLSAAGNALLYGTYLGGSGNDSVNSLAVNANGVATLAGETLSGDFPLMNPFQSRLRGGQEGFISRINTEAGLLVWSTFLGGSADEKVNAVTVDSAGAAYVTGGTFSMDFPLAQPLQAQNAGGQDAFITKISADGQALLYSTYLGGSAGSVSSPEAGMGAGVDLTGSIYVAGVTCSSNFPVVAAIQPTPRGGTDVFVAKLDPAGTRLLYSTYFGGTSLDYALALAVAPSGMMAVAGYTSSADFPVVRGLQNTRGGSYDAFVARFSPVGDLVEFSTYWGGGDSDAAYALAMDRSGNLWMGGQTLSVNFPLAAAVQTTDAGGGSGFIARFVDWTPVASFRDINGNTRISLYGSTQLPAAGGNISSELSVWQTSAGAVYVAGSNASTCVYMNTFRLTSHSWAGWLRVGCGMTGNPAVVANEAGVAWVIARDSAYNYYLSRYQPGAGFTAWTNLGGGFTTDPSAALSSDGSVYIAGRRSDDRVYAGRWEDTGGFRGWVQASAGPTVVGKPAITCGSDGAAYVAVRATDRTTWIARFAGDRWGTWYSAGGTAYGGPDVAAGAGTIYVTVTNINNLVYVRPFLEGTGNGWQAWMSLSGYLKRPAICAVGRRFFVTGRDTANNLWWYESGVGWTNLGHGSLTGGEPNAGPR